MPQPQTSHKVLQNTAMCSLAALLAFAAGPAVAQSGLVKTANASKVSEVKSADPKTVNSKVSTPKSADSNPPALKAPVLRPIPPAVHEAVLSPTKSTTTNSVDTKNVSSKSSGSEIKTEISGQKKEVKKTEIKTATKEKKATTSPNRIKRSNANPVLRNGLIPPPPPIMLSGPGYLGFPFAQPVDYLSLKELESRKKELSLRLAELESIAKESERQIAERKDRATLFQSLYAEGVVSRKELETATREAGDIDRDVKFRVDELDSTRQSLKAVTNRLDSLKKQDRASKSSSVAAKKKRSK